MRFFVLLVSMSVFACSRPDASTAVSSTHALESDRTHLLLTVELTPGALKLLQSTVVEQPLPRLRQPEPQPWSVELVDPRGASVFQAAIPAHNQLRGEFDDRGETSGTHLVLTNAVFQVRTPAQRGTVILRAQRLSLAEGDPRRGGDGEEVELGRFELP